MYDPGAGDSAGMVAEQPLALPELASEDPAVAATDTDFPLATAFAAVIANAGVRPYSSVVRIVSSLGQGSGVLVAPDEVLTAAHVVWDPSALRPATSASVTPGQTEGSHPFGTVTVTNWHNNNIVALFGFSASTTHQDYALLHLSAPVGAQTGTMLLDPTFHGGAVHVSGYPGASPFDGNQDVDLTPVTTTADNINGILQLSPTGVFQGVSRSVIVPGSSGGPLWYSDAAGRPEVVGLVSAGNSVAVNASWITPAVQSQIVGWYLADHPTHSTAPAIEAALFDPAYYLVKYPDVMAAGADALQHFTTAGWIEHRNPDSVFDVNYYLQHNQDVARLGMDPLLHYAEFGWKEGRDPSASFSTSHYLAVNHDVKLAGVDPLQHYLQFGLAEHRPI